MSLAALTYKIFDIVFMPFIGFLVPKMVIRKRLEIEKKNIFREDSDGAIDQYLLDMIGTINARVSTMVSHLSLMLALTIFLWAHVGGNSKFFLMLETAVYIFLVLVALRCLRPFSLQKDFENVTEHREHIWEELTIKYCMMEFATALTIWATFGLLVTMALEVLIVQGA